MKAGFYPFFKKFKWLIPKGHLLYRIPGGAGKMGGYRIYLNVHESEMMMKRAFGVYEPEKTKRLKEHLEFGGLFIDIGANKGDFTLLASTILGKDGMIWSFEPEPKNIKWLNKSIKANGFTNIQVFETALANRNEKATLYLGEKSGWHTLIPGLKKREAGQLEVSVKRLDDLVSSLETDSIQAIKIDVEGAELEVLHGATLTLKKYKPRLFIDLHPKLRVDVKQVLEFLHIHNYTLYNMDLDKIYEPEEIINNELIAL